MRWTVADGSQPTRKERVADNDEVPSPAEQVRILGELDLERQLEADDDAARERELDERDNETPSRWWTGGLR